jgi:hypothetical protein
MELARPEGQSSNSFLETLTEWNVRLERATCFQNSSGQGGSYLQKKLEEAAMTAPSVL